MGKIMRGIAAFMKVFVRIVASLVRTLVFPKRDSSIKKVALYVLQCAMDVESTQLSLVCKSL